ncbi:hypothetical protein RFI_09035 [Reticulomyxa filosa]|uniref:F-box domain-containing protein n=1 Tax=Reticulomyxa filosa TaxID=46433 RepID=X6NQ96_RETFI|nr:hypothetical protein RFI_09035 [Reticulomyxa filosa]|eukprot:ETO28093.1 hypothetical protein RFI_09035 [Reticulomyxa filosa]
MNTATTKLLQWVDEVTTSHRELWKLFELDLLDFNIIKAQIKKEITTNTFVLTKRQWPTSQASQLAYSLLPLDALLPADVIVYVFQFLSLKEIAKTIRQISTRWNALTYTRMAPYFENYALSIHLTSTWTNIEVAQLKGNARVCAVHHRTMCRNYVDETTSNLLRSVRGVSQVYIEVLSGLQARRLYLNILCHLEKYTLLPHLEVLKCDYLDKFIVPFLSKCVNLTELELYYVSPHVLDGSDDISTIVSDNDNDDDNDDGNNDKGPLKVSISVNADQMTSNFEDSKQYAQLPKLRVMHAFGINPTCLLHPNVIRQVCTQTTKGLESIQTLKILLIYVYIFICFL